MTFSAPSTGLEVALSAALTILFMLTTLFNRQSTSCRLPKSALYSSTWMCNAGELRVYNEKQLVSTTKMPSPVGAMVFGRYGREEHALISILTSGAPDKLQQGLA